MTIVIPTYNERNNLRPLVTELLDLLPAAHVVVVDDGSPDGTGMIADALAEETGNVTVIHRPRKSGIGPAYIAGFDVALSRDADVIVAMDADGSHAPADLIRLIDTARHADLVLGSRYVAGGQTLGWPLSRRLLSRFGGLYARLVLGIPIADLTTGFKVYQRDALAAIPFDRVTSDGYGFQIETTWHVVRQGRKVVEAPITFRDRVAGKSKLSRKIVIEAALMVWQLCLRR